MHPSDIHAPIWHPCTISHMTNGARLVCSHYWQCKSKYRVDLGMRPGARLVSFLVSLVIQGTRHSQTSDVWGKRAMETGSASPKHNVQTTTWMGRWRRGHLCMNALLWGQRSNCMNHFARKSTDERSTPTIREGWRMGIHKQGLSQEFINPMKPTKEHMTSIMAAAFLCW